MKFMYSCIGDNSPENREHLRILGWKEKYYQEDADTIVCASNTGLFSVIISKDQRWFKDYEKECVSCIGNPQLFRAVTAMRGDSDKWQYFISDNEDWFICGFSPFDGYLNPATGYSENARKATLEELINHFARND